MFLTILLSHIYFKVFGIQNKNDKFNLHYYYKSFQVSIRISRFFFFMSDTNLKTVKTSVMMCWNLEHPS
jgi:hypothetical protein